MPTSTNLHRFIVVHDVQLVQAHLGWLVTHCDTAILIILDLGVGFLTTWGRHHSCWQNECEDISIVPRCISDNFKDFSVSLSHLWNFKDMRYKTQTAAVVLKMLDVNAHNTVQANCSFRVSFLCCSRHKTLANHPFTVHILSVTLPLLSTSIAHWCTHTIDLLPQHAL